MDKPVYREPKKQYSSPKLSVYGTVQQLTQAVGLRRHRDGGSFPTTRTALR
jgi:hypothetical protein